jgi:hypothetical protein
MKNFLENFGICIVLFLFVLLTACTKEECREKRVGGCMHTEEYNPVCGCNGKTYSNPSEAACNNIKDYKQGPCEGIRE